MLEQLERRTSAATVAPARADKPLGPIGWSVALSASAGATLGGALWTRYEAQLLALLNDLRKRAGAASPAADSSEASSAPVPPLTAADLLRPFMPAAARS